MNRLALVIPLVLSALLHAGEAETNADVLVYCGTPGGIAAALAARREGLNVTLLETTKHLGGMSSGGLSHTDVGPRPEIIGGLTREFYTRADAYYRERDPARTAAQFWYHEPGVAERTFIDLLREAGVQTVFGARVESVAKKGARIESLKTIDGRVFTARCFIDASYEGDVLARAGVSYSVGRESTEQFNEALAGFLPAEIRPVTAEYMGRAGSVYTHGTPAKISAKDAAGKLLSGIGSAWQVVGAGDKHPQSYTFRIILTKDPANRVPFPKPARYDPLTYEILARIVDAFPGVRFEKLVFLGALPHGKFDANASGLVQGTDFVGGNLDYPDGDYVTRDRIWQAHVEYVQGFFWFLANDPRVPAPLRAQAGEYGLAKDEFIDNANWPYALYVREARRMNGAYVMRQSDCDRETAKPDSVGIGAFILDSHAVQRLADRFGNVIDEGNFDVPVNPYQIPYRCLTPKKEQCENLLVPVCLSATHVAYGSMRMEPQFMILGQSAGVAAAQALKKSCAVQDVDVPALQARLRELKQVLELRLNLEKPLEAFSGIVVDDSEAQYEGEWFTTNFGNAIANSSHHDGNGVKGKKTARFMAKIPEDGLYTVRFAYVNSANRASNVPVTVEHADGSQTILVDERQKPERHFVTLGTFRFTKEKGALIVVGTAKTDGYVSVDAVQLLALPK